MNRKFLVVLPLEESVFSHYSNNECITCSRFARTSKCAKMNESKLRLVYRKLKNGTIMQRKTYFLH